VDEDRRWLARSSAPERQESPQSVDVGLGQLATAHYVEIVEPKFWRQEVRSQTKTGVARWFLTRLGRRPYAMYSPTPPDRLIARLDEHLTRPFNFNVVLSRSLRLMGRTHSDRVLVYGRSALRRNSFDWRLRASVTPDNHGSCLSGTVGPMLAVSTFVTLWALGALTFLFVAVLNLIAGARHPGDPPPILFVLVPLGMLGLWGALVELGYRSALRQWQRVEGLIAGILKARIRAVP
jgi:hypothetical protein